MNLTGNSPSVARLAFLLALLTCTVSASAKKPKPVAHWTGSWRTALFALDAAEHPELTRVGFGGAAVTLRQTVHVSLGGTLVRVELSNAFGTEPLTLDSVHIALVGAKPGTISLATANALTFNGVPRATIAAGATIFSDPAALALKPGDDLVVSMLVPQQAVSRITGHADAFQTNYLAAGDLVGARSLPTGNDAAPGPGPDAGPDPTTPAPRPVETTTSWFFLQGVEVKTPAEPAIARSAVVTFGDSITDGASSTRNANARWPDVFARRLAANKATERVGVLNTGIGGNRLLLDGRGPRASARFERDVLDAAGARFVVLLEGINDIGGATGPGHAPGSLTAEDLIAALTDLSRRAHAKGLRVIGGTLTPYAGAGYSSLAGETIRQTVNKWMRTTPLVDKVLDFDQVTRDPEHPDHLLPAFDCGDHLHPNDAGYKAMGEALDLRWFAGKVK